MLDASRSGWGGGRGGTGVCVCVGMGGVANHVSLHFGLLGPESSWFSVLETGEGGCICTQQLPPAATRFFSIWALYIQMGTEMDVSFDKTCPHSNG